MISAVRAVGALRGLIAVALFAFALAPASAGAAMPAWTTYDHDVLRSATDPDSGSPLAPTLAWSTSTQLDGEVFAQPLVYGSRVYVATENDTVYALDTATGAVVWARSVGTAVPAADLPCGNIKPTVGVTSTPVIDPASGRLYAVADSTDGTAVQHRLVALDLATGTPVATPVNVDPPGADPTALLQRASLVLDAGRVIIPYGGNAGDCGTYHGWLVSAAEAGGTPDAFEITPSAGDHGGAIWGGGDGPSLDLAGHVFVSTGNGFSPAGTTTPDLQESVLELDPSLNLIAHWTASNWQALDNSDQDLGSSEPLPLPGGLLFIVGKDGYGRLLSQTALGSAGQVFSASVCGTRNGDGGSLYRAGVIYVPCLGGLEALTLSTSPSPSFSMQPGWSAPTGAVGPPIFAGGLVWSTGWGGSGILYGLDPATGEVRFQSQLGTFNHFATPSAGGGRLFVAVGTQLTAFTIAGFPPPTTTTLSSSADPAPSGNPVTLTATVSPPPDGGTVSFTDAGAALPGCASVSADAVTGQAACRSSLVVGTHAIVAGYSGDPYYAGSTSAPLSQVIAPMPAPPKSHGRPRLSALNLGARRFTARRGTRLRLTLSQAGTLQIQISRTLSGRRVAGRCRAGARHGRRCTIARRARRMRLRAKRGRQQLRLNVRGLRPGSYVATIVLRGSSGRTSKTVTVRFAIIAIIATRR